MPASIWKCLVGNNNYLRPNKQPLTPPIFFFFFCQSCGGLALNSWSVCLLPFSWSIWRAFCMRCRALFMPNGHLLPPAQFSSQNGVCSAPNEGLWLGSPSEREVGALKSLVNSGMCDSYPDLRGVDAAFHATCDIRNDRVEAIAVHFDVVWLPSLRTAWRLHLFALVFRISVLDSAVLCHSCAALVAYVVDTLCKHLGCQRCVKNPFEAVMGLYFFHRQQLCPFDQCFSWPR